MEAQTNINLGFPLRLFSLGYEPKPKKSINYHSKTDFLEDVESAVGKEVWNNIRESPLGVIVRFVDNKFTWSSKVVEYLLAKQLVCKKKYEIWCLFGDKPARFSLSEFEEITALDCAPFPDDCEVDVEAKLHKELWKKLKIKGKTNPCKNDLRRVCEDVATWSDDDDKTRFAYLSIASVILGYDDKKRLSSPIARMVFDLPKFKKYPWGRMVFKQLIESVKRIDYNAQSYTIHGFTQALQIWAYIIVPGLGTKIGRPSYVDGPPLLKFKGTKGKSNIDIHTIVVNDENNIKKVIVKHLTSAVWEDAVVDKEIDALLEAICKEGSLQTVTWVKDGSTDLQLEENIKEELCGKAEEENRSDDDTKISLKRKREVDTMSMKKTLDSRASIISSESVETLQLRIDQQTKKIEVLEAQLEAMKNQQQIIELMRLRVDLLEKEITLLSEKLKTNEVLKEYKLRDFSDDEETHVGEMHANLDVLNGTRQKVVNSDEESIVDGRDPKKNCNEQPQQSSPVKIFQPTASNIETFKQMKIGKTIKIMETNHDTKIVREKSKRETKPGPSLLTPYRGTQPAVGITKTENQSMAIVGHGYDPFAPVDDQKVKVLDDWLRLDKYVVYLCDCHVTNVVILLHFFHWVGLFISIPNRYVDVFDCGYKGSTNEDIVTAVKPIAHMLPHLLRAAASSIEKAKMSVEQYKIRRPRTKIPQMHKVGDCRIYAIKFVECHALNAEFTQPLSDTSIKMVREKLAAEIFDETEQDGRTVSNPIPIGTNDHE